MTMRSFLATSLALLLACIGAGRLIDLDPTLPGPFDRMELLPYVALVGLSIALPFVVLHRLGRFNPAHPMLFLSLGYLGPMLFGGSLIFVVTGITHVPDELVPDPALSYRLAISYTAIAIAAMTLGALATAPRNAGLRLGSRLPRLDWLPSLILLPGVVFLIFGVAMQVVNYKTGLIGYQIAAVGPFTALFYYVGLCFVIGQFLVWSAIFAAERRGRFFLAAGALAILAALAVAVLAGSRGFLVSCWIVMALACFTSGRRMSVRRLSFLAISGVVALVVGFALGTIFRDIKAGLVAPRQVTTIETKAAGRDAHSAAPAPRRTPLPGAPAPAPATPAQIAQRQTSLSEQASNIREAVAVAASGERLPAVVQAFAARTNIVTQLAVLVAQRDRLADTLPASLRSGILLSLATAIVPRVLWPEKPVVGDTANYALYFFGFVGNSFAITPYGDLFLNFGAAGIVPGMILLGAFLGLAHAVLVESAPGAAGRGAIYMILLTQTSMEGFYATIMPSLMRATMIAVLAVTAAALMVAIQRRLLGRSSGSRGLVNRSGAQ